MAQTRPRKRKGKGRMVMVNLRLPRELRDQAQEKADERDLPLSYVLRQAIKRGLE